MLMCTPGTAQEARDTRLRRIMVYRDWEHMDEEQFQEMVSNPCPSYRFPTWRFEVFARMLIWYFAQLRARAPSNFGVLTYTHLATVHFSAPSLFSLFSIPVTHT
jgi:hypothetical protein